MRTKLLMAMLLLNYGALQAENSAMGTMPHDTSIELTSEGTDETIMLTQAGTLQENVASIQSMQIRSIKVVGPINGADLAYLHTKTGRLSTLAGIDLSETTLDPDEVVYASRTVNSDIGMGSTTYQYIMSNEDREERSSSPTGLGGATVSVKVFNTRLAGAFLDMDALKYAILPQEITELGEYTYAGCSKLLEASVPQTTTAIPEGAFSDCTSLRSIAWPDGVQEIEELAFARCGIASAELQDVKRMGRSAFLASGLVGTVNLSSLTTVPENAFRNSESLTGVVLSENIDSIYPQAFEYTGLTSLAIPKDFKYIGTYAFGYSNLENVEIPDKGGMIGHGAFCETPWFERLLENAGPDEIIYLGTTAHCVNMASKYYVKQTTFIIKEGTRYLSEYIFSDQTPITKVSLPSTLLEIGDRAFYRCSNLAEVRLPGSLQKIGKQAFQNCSAMKEATFGEALRKIDEEAFAWCTGLGAVTLGKGIEHIGDHAFGWCDGLVRIEYDVPDANGTYIFGYCKGLEKITFGSNVMNIPEYFAIDCNNLIQLDFENMPKVQLAKATSGTATGNKELTIGDGAFSGSPLMSAVLPEYLTKIGDGAFYGNALKTVTCYLRYPIDIEDTYLIANGKQTTIYLAEDVVDTFSQEVHWNQCNLKGVAFITGVNNTIVDNVDARYRWYDLSGKNLSSPGKGLNLKVYENGKVLKTPHSIKSPAGNHND